VDRAAFGVNMKEISIDDAIQFLKGCAAIIIEDTVVYPTVYYNDNTFLYINNDGHDKEFDYYFQKNANQIVKIEDSTMYLIDENKQEREIIILEEQHLEEDYQAMIGER
jgi:hypothetical protein